MKLFGTIFLFFSLQASAEWVDLSELKKRASFALQKTGLGMDFVCNKVNDQAEFNSCPIKKKAAFLKQEITKIQNQNVALFEQMRDAGMNPERSRLYEKEITRRKKCKLKQTDLELPEFAVNHINQKLNENCRVKEIDHQCESSDNEITALLEKTSRKEARLMAQVQENHWLLKKNLTIIRLDMMDSFNKIVDSNKKCSDEIEHKLINNPTCLNTYESVLLNEIFEPIVKACTIETVDIIVDRFAARMRSDYMESFASRFYVIRDRHGKNRIREAEFAAKLAEIHERIQQLEQEPRLPANQQEDAPHADVPSG